VDKPPYKLQLTNGFFLEFAQIARMVSFAIQQPQKRVPTEAYTARIGLSVRRVENIGSMAAAMGLLRPVVLTATELGHLVQRHDPFFDDLGTLWLLHHSISSNDRYVIWNRLVNQVIPENQRLSTAIARPYFDDLRQFYSERSLDHHVRTEMGAVWNAYTEQAFAHLDYLRAESEQIYVRGYGAAVPPLIFLAAALLYRERYAPNAATIDIPTLAGAPNSPGRVFGLTQRQVRDILDKVQGRGSVYVESRADLDQVRFRDDLGFIDAVGRYYEER